MLSKKNTKVLRDAGRKIYKATGLVNPIKKGKVSTARLIKDIALLKATINAEKKRFVQTTANAQQLAQVVANASGHFIADITPLIPQGSGNSQRNGSSVKPHSMFMEMQFFHQANTQQKTRYELEIFIVKGVPISSMSTAVTQLYNGNNFIAGQNAGSPIIIDAMSSRDQDYFKDFKRIYKKNFTIDPDQFSGQSVIKYLKIGIKFKNGYHVKYNDDTNNLSAGQLIMLIRADNGNCSGATACTLTGVPVTGINTGAYLNYNNTYYYYDN